MKTRRIHLDDEHHETRQRSHEVRSAFERVPDNNRSAVSNGRTLFAEGGDGRGAWARRFRDLVAEHVSDMGGPAGLSEAQRSLVRRISTLEVQLEQLEARFSEGPAREGDLALYSTLSNTLRRHLEVIGLNKRPKDITPPTDLGDDFAANTRRIHAYIDAEVG